MEAMKQHMDIMQQKVKDAEEKQKIAEECLKQTIEIIGTIGSVALKKK